MAILKELVDEEKNVSLSTYIKNQYFIQELEIEKYKKNFKSLGEYRVAAHKSICVHR